MSLLVARSIYSGGASRPRTRCSGVAGERAILSARSPPRESSYYRRPVALDRSRHKSFLAGPCVTSVRHATTTTAIIKPTALRPGPVRSTHAAHMRRVRNVSQLLRASHRPASAAWINIRSVARSIRRRRPINNEFMSSAHCTPDLAHLSKRFAPPRFETFVCAVRGVQSTARPRSCTKDFPTCGGIRAA